MINQFNLLGRVNVLSKDNPDYPGIYLELLDTKELVPISFNPEVMHSYLKELSNGDVIGIKGRVSMKDTQVILITERITLVSRCTTGKVIKEIR